MPNPAVAIERAVEQAKREALIAELKTLPDMTVAELVTVKGEVGKLVAQLTMGELMNGTGTPTPGTARAATSRKSGRKPRPKRAKVNHAELDAKLLQVIKVAKNPIGSEAIRAKIGGDPVHLGQSLRRLLDAKKVKRSGMARGTKYWVK